MYGGSPQLREDVLTEEDVLLAEGWVDDQRTKHGEVPCFCGKLIEQMAIGIFNKVHSTLKRPCGNHFIHYF